MGKIVAIALVLGLAYAWHKGMLDEVLGQRADAPSAAPAKPAARYDHRKRYEGADTSPAEQCAQARAKLRELEGWPDKKDVLEQTRQFVEDRCRGL